MTGIQLQLGRLSECPNSPTGECRDNGVRNVPDAKGHKHRFLFTQNFRLKQNDDEKEKRNK